MGALVSLAINAAVEIYFVIKQIKENEKNNQNQLPNGNDYQNKTTNRTGLNELSKMMNEKVGLALSVRTADVLSFDADPNWGVSSTAEKRTMYDYIDYFVWLYHPNYYQEFVKSGFGTAEHFESDKNEVEALEYELLSVIAKIYAQGRITKDLLEKYPKTNGFSVTASAFRHIEIPPLPEGYEYYIDAKINTPDSVGYEAFRRKKYDVKWVPAWVVLDNDFVINPIPSNPQIYYNKETKAKVVGKEIQWIEPGETYKMIEGKDYWQGIYAIRSALNTIIQAAVFKARPELKPEDPKEVEEKRNEPKAGEEPKPVQAPAVAQEVKRQKVLSTPIKAPPISETQQRITSIAERFQKQRNKISGSGLDMDFAACRNHKYVETFPRSLVGRGGDFDPPPTEETNPPSTEEKKKEEEKAIADVLPPAIKQEKKQVTSSQIKAPELSDTQKRINSIAQRFLSQRKKI